MPENYYHILGLDSSTSQAGIKAAFRKLAKKYHPDKNPGNQEIEEYFKQISEAYLTLSDPNKKADYDWRLYQKYAVNTQEKTVYRQKTAYQRPRYHPNPFFTNRKYRYSKKVKRQGAIFVICLALVAIVVPLGLEIFSAERHYDNGLAYYKTGNYFAAINSLEQSFRAFGLRNLEASILASKAEANQGNSRNGREQLLGQPIRQRGKFRRALPINDKGNPARSRRRHARFSFCSHGYLRHNQRMH